MRRSLRVPVDRFVWLALALSLGLRLATIFIYYQTVEPHGADSLFYISVARQLDRLWFGAQSLDPITTIGPGYPLFLIPFFSFPLSDVTRLLLIRICHALLDTATVFLIYSIAGTLFSQRIARIALVAQGLDPRYLFQNGAIATETLFITIFVLFVWLYLRAIQYIDWSLFRLAGLILGVSILIRPLPLLLPVALAIALWVAFRYRRELWIGFAWMLSIMAITLLPWLVRTMIVSGDLIPIASTATTHFWLSTYEEGRDLGGDAFSDTKREVFGEDETGNIDASEADFIETGVTNILQAPSVWLGRVLGDTLGAYLQPYGTIYLVPEGTPGALQSLRAVLSGQADISGVLSLPGLWRRLLMYIWHFWGLLFGLAGAAIVWRKDDWRAALPLVAWIVYGTVVTAALLIEPRYIFPLMFAFTIMAAYATISLWDRLPLRRASISANAPDMA